MSPRIPLTARIALPALAIGAGVACDYTGDWLFAGAVENMPGIMHIYAEDGGELLTPIAATGPDDVRAQTIYAEIGPTGNATQGGATFNFLGTGGPVCIFVDPETVFWSWSVSPNPSGEARAWSYPDNVFDDGDIDLYVGLSAYYTGSPGVEIGDFFVQYSDKLGNNVPIELSECSNIGIRDQLNAHAGRGFPEMCDLPFTDPGVSYTALLQTFSTPLDDDRLGFGLILYDGSCASLIQDMTTVIPTQQADNPWIQECVISGESIVPRPIGPNELTYCTGEGCKDTWPGSVVFETAYCAGQSADMRAFCRDEADEKFEAGIECELETIENLDARCYCGDVNDIPTPGAL